MDFVKARNEAAAAAATAISSDAQLQCRMLVEGHPFLPTTSVALSKKASHKDKVAALAPIVANIFYLNNDNNNKQEEKRLEERLLIEHVEGGLSNTLFKISNIHDAFQVNADADNKLFIPDFVLVRLFGAEGMIDRDVETSIFAALAAKGIAPPYYGAFGNGRLEGWMEGMRPLTVREMAQPVIAQGIAQQLAQLHYGFALPPQLIDSLSPAQRQPGLWTQLEEWYAQALGNVYRTEYDEQRANDLGLPRLQRELDWLRAEITDNNSDVGATQQQQQQQLSVRLCHNDVLAANVLVDESYTHEGGNVPKIQLIDFEYGGFNYTSFDIANHWNEYAGGPPHDAIPNYDWFPNSARQVAFVQAYVQAANDILLQKQQEEKPNEANLLLLSVEQLLPEIQGFVLVNHLYWGLWAVNQAANEGCEDYDYMLYGMKRFEQYWMSKTHQERRHGQMNKRDGNKSQSALLGGEDEVATRSTDSTNSSLSNVMAEDNRSEHKTDF